MIADACIRSGCCNRCREPTAAIGWPREANKITALEVIRAIDGPIILTACFTAHGECDQSEKCTVREPLRKVHEGILNLLNTITISDMSKNEPVETLLRIS